MKSTLPLLFLLVTLPAAADIYKCRQPGGRIEISNTPCAGGSNTVKTMPDDTVSEANRQQAERDNARMENYADKLEAKREADAKTERRAREKQQAAAAAYAGPSAASVEFCLHTLDRMALDSARRSEMESGCRATGSVPPVNQTAPYYYGGPAYLVPHPPHPRPKPLPAPVSRPPTGKPANIYQSPNNYRAR